MSAGKRRLSPSFALALCVGVAYFGLLDALIGVRVALVIPTIPHVAYRPVALAISALPEKPDRGCVFEIREHFPTPRPAIPPLEIDVPWMEMIDERSSSEVRQFDPRDAIDAFNATTIVM
jgi:hypothetical protein